MEDEVGASFQAYQSLWEARAELLASVSLTLSQMSDVRSAFGTRDPATIRDTANELWKKLAIKNAVFLVTDAPAKSSPPSAACPLPQQDVRSAAAQRFPRAGVRLSGAWRQPLPNRFHARSTWKTCRKTCSWPATASIAWWPGSSKPTPAAANSSSSSGGAPIASSLDPEARASVASRLAAHPSRGARVTAAASSTPRVPRRLLDIEGKPIGDLWILRSFATAGERLADPAPQYHPALAAGGGRQPGPYLPAGAPHRRAAERTRPRRRRSRPPELRPPRESGQQGRTGPPRPHLQRHVRLHPAGPPGTDPPGAHLHHRPPFQFHRARSPQSARGGLWRRRNAGGCRSLPRPR